MHTGFAVLVSLKQLIDRLLFGSTALDEKDEFTFIFSFSFFHCSGLVILICAPVVSPLRRCPHVLTAGWLPSVTWPGGGVQSSLCSYLRDQTSPGRLKVRRCSEGRRLADSGPWSLRRRRPPPPERASIGTRCRKRRGKSRWDTRCCAPSAPELTGPYGESTRAGGVHDPRRSDQGDTAAEFAPVWCNSRAESFSPDVWHLHNCHNNTAQTSKCSNVYIFYLFYDRTCL